MFELCLFDLDETLVKTDDLTDLRESDDDKNGQAYKAELAKKLKPTKVELYIHTV